MSTQDKPVPTYSKFLCSGLGGMAAAFTMHPMDFMKTRMQMSGREGQKRLYTSTFDAMKKIYKAEGIFAFYTGATAALLRQATYSTARIGIYTSLLEALTTEEGPPSFIVKAGIGMFGGIFGGFVGTPADLCLIRMVSDGSKPPSQRFYYKNVFDALIRIVREEGVLRLWKGGVPTMMRAVAVNGSVMATYSQSKEFLLSTGFFNDDLIMYFTASMISGIVSAIITLPIDIVKTRVQSAKIAKGPRKGIHIIFINILKEEGVFALWKGFTPYCARFAPVTVLTFVFIEKISIGYQRYILGNKNIKKTF